jgi:hypothetical protein
MFLKNKKTKIYLINKKDYIIPNSYPIICFEKQEIMIILF